MANFKDYCWQLIECAPKDGRRLQIAVDTELESYYIHVGRWNGQQWVYDSPWLCHKKPTHFKHIDSPDNDIVRELLGEKKKLREALEKIERMALKQVNPSNNSWKLYELIASIAQQVPNCGKIDG